MSRGRMAMIVLGLVLGTAGPAGAAGGRVRQAASPSLTNVVVTRDGSFVHVSLRGSAPLPAVAPQRTTSGPPRLFVDLPGVVMGGVAARIPGSGPIAAVRVALNSVDPVITRVVFDLTGDVTFGVVTAGPESHDITIAVAPVAAPSPPARAAVPIRMAPAPRAVAPPVPVAPSAPPRSVSSTPAVSVPAATPRPAAATTVTPPATAPATPGAAMTVQSAPPPPRPMGGFGVGRTPRPTGRVAVYASGARATQTNGVSTGYGDVMTAVSYSFLDRDTDGVEYGLDLRHTAYTIEGRDPRVSIYNGFVGARLAGGHAAVRAGHLWLDDLGSLGSVAGVQLEARSGAIPKAGLGRWRGGLFGGLDPDVYRFGYGEGIRKVGGYAVLEGTRGRRHVAGYVNIHNGDMTERSVLSVANFVPAGPVFAYQVAEYDLSPIAGGLGHGGLTYLFTNLRWTVNRRVELQGTVSRGRSVDARGLSDDIQAGRPVTQQAVDGLLYQSYGGRVTAEVLPRVRVYGGYSRDRNNRDDAPTGRWLAGGFASDVLGSGLDLTFSNSRMTRSTGSYHSTYVSAGRELGRRIYATAEFSTALSQVRFTRGDGLVVETRPSTKRVGGNASIQLWRAMSAYVSVERTLDNDGYREWRALSGLTFRLH